MNDENRPSPDEILSRIEQDQIRSARGRLKVFFGMSPGVGKTYAMLRAAHEQKTMGRNVLIGIVETHLRAETEKLLEQLEVLPRKKIPYKDKELEEFNLDEALMRHPELILVDELAHSNVPGSRHPKRYQDVEELLSAGIDVYTTLNVQHIESRADLVYQISGAPVRETVPDVFLEKADQIELIDLSPEDLLKRLKDGKVYLGDRAERAQEGFFRPEKLTALRELALRFTAEVVDDQLRDQMREKRISGPWNTNERLLVAISQSPSSARLIRATRRMAYSLEAPWVALYVETQDELSARDHEQLTKHLNLARELGAEVVTTKDTSVSRAIKRVAEEKNVTQIVMGRPDRRFLKDLLNRGTILDQLVNETSEIDVHVIRQKRRPLFRGFYIPRPRFTEGPFVYLQVFFYTVAMVMIAYVFRNLIGYRSIGYGLLLGIVPVSIVSGLGPMTLSAATAALSWDFFFIPPYFTFAVTETEDQMMIFVFFVVAMVSGFLTSRIKRQQFDLRQREKRANTLYEFGRKALKSKSKSELAEFAAQSLESVFSARIVFAIRSVGGPREIEAVGSSTEKIDDKTYSVAHWAYTHQKKAGWRTDTLPLSECMCIPLIGAKGCVGVVALFPVQLRSLTLDQENLIEAILRQLAVAFERLDYEKEAREQDLLVASEKLYKTLFNTISHELRTPLTAIAGSLSSIRGLENSVSVEQGTEGVQRLNHTIENLLDMSRISTGMLKLKDETIELNDFVLSTINRLKGEFKRVSIEPHLQSEDSFFLGDEKILEHVMHNLLSNSARYSQAGSKVQIATTSTVESVVISISDEGPGIPGHQLDRVFEPFFRGENSPTGGVGLGLSICKSILEAHHGKIFARNRSDRSGAIFRIELPRVSLPQGVIE